MDDFAHAVLAELAAAGLRLEGAAAERLAVCITPTTSPSRLFGPQHDAVRDAFGRLLAVTDSEGTIAEQASLTSWGVSDLEPAPSHLRGALHASGQPSPPILNFLYEEVRYNTATSHAAAFVLALGLQAVVGAHLLSPLHWSHWTGPLIAALGPVPYPASELTATVAGCGQPVGSHLLGSWSWSAHSCSCERPFPALSHDGTRIAKAIAEGSSDWIGCIDAARRLDPNPIS